MTYTLRDVTEDTLKLWGIDEVPRDGRNRQEFARDVMRTYNRMQPQRTVARRTTLEDFNED